MTTYNERLRDYMRAYHIRQHYKALKKDRYNLRPSREAQQGLLRLGYPVNIAKGV